MVLKFSLTGEGVIRHAQATDVRHLEWHGGADLRSFYEACWQAHQQGESTLLVADLNGFPIGQVVIVWSGKASHPHFPDLQSLRVHSAFRGMGVGSKLLHAAEQLVAARGFAQAGLSVGLDNPHAQRLYQRLGYHPTGAVYDDEWSYIDASGRFCPQVERVMDLVKPLAKD
jgi:ribosomal protein S18 acetylase RimI-like enzyme